MSLTRLPGVYRPQDDTSLLTEALAEAGVRPGAAVLDIGCGTGALSIAAARTRPRSITSVDVCRRAVWTARLNAALRGVRAEIVHGDAFALGLCDEEKTLRLLRGGGLKATVVARADLPFGPVMRARRDALVEQGLITPAQSTEELVVIRGDQPASA